MKNELMSKKVHELQVELQIGKNGLTDIITKDILARFKKKEFIKLKILKSSKESFKPIMEKLLMIIKPKEMISRGNIILLYKPRKK